MPLAYRDDIDGLRALAVMLVVFYHLQIDLFAGGFVGVDVFFVISGFLITGNIRRSLASSTFTFKEFYLRRIRRLAPALLVTIVASFMVAAYLFTATNMQRFGGEVVTSLLWTSNIYFHLESGYFDASAAVKPLLHTWSLSVEEQFYLFWPLLLFFAVPRLSGWRTPILIAALSLFSLIAAELLLTQGWNLFFLTPFRLFEFGIGALLTWIIDRRPKSEWFGEVVNLIGLALIVFSALTYDESVPFPSIAALVPCGGAAMVLYAGTASRSGLLLRNRVSTHIGKISYSLYLVHWPVVVFFAYALGNDDLQFGFLATALLLVVTMVLAEALYWLVEKPFRAGNPQRPLVGQKIFIPSLAVLTVLVSVAGAHAYLTGGWLWRYSSEDIALARAIQSTPSPKGKCQYFGYGGVDAEFQESLDSCFATYGPAVIVLGDSHGMNLHDALAYRSDRAHLPGIGRGGCRITNPESLCDYQLTAQFILENSSKIKAVIYTQDMWSLADGNRMDTSAVQSVLEYLHTFQTAGIETMWVGPQREPRIDLAKTSAAELQKIDLQSTEAKLVYSLDPQIEEVSESQGVPYVSKVKATESFAPLYLIVDGQITYKDKDHWSEYGKIVFGDALLGYSEDLREILE